VRALSGLAGLGFDRGESNLLITRRETVFGAGRAVPLDRNAKARIAAYARSWSARYRQPGQTHRGPITRAFLEVLQALLWGFHNSRSGCCFPSYEAIADRAGCARSTVAPNRLVLRDSVAVGERFEIAVFAIKGPISAAPANFLWFREAKVEFYR
jgi:hypothetical protein